MKKDNNEILDNNHFNWNNKFNQDKHWPHQAVYINHLVFHLTGDYDITFCDDCAIYDCDLIIGCPQCHILKELNRYLLKLKWHMLKHSKNSGQKQ